MRYERLEYHVAHRLTHHERLCMRGLSLITHLDDASRCVTKTALSKKTISENAVVVLRQTVGRFGVPVTILPDNSCFVGAGGRKKPTGTRRRLFENELLTLNIGLISSRPYSP